MRKGFFIIMSCILAVSVMAGPAFAKSDGSGSKEDRRSNQAKHEDNERDQRDGNNQHHEDDGRDSVTSDTYDKQSHKDRDHQDEDQDGNQDNEDKDHKGESGYKGLFKAIDKIKDKSAGAAIADLLLTKYNTALTPEMKAELEAIIEKDKALSAVADMLDKKGSVTEAVYVGKDAIRANVKNLESYKKLGKMYEKMGKKGVKLYVNGEEPSVEVAPIIQDGNTLVPFRAISESLKANVSWNADERSVTVTRNGITVKLFIDSKTAYVDGIPVTLEVPATIVAGSTVVPARFVSEALKAAVKWESETQSVVIYEE
jgi:predicted DNA-binding protein YlxM (UPF0122 family)/Ni/Co efflux regulator RcnB